MCDIMQAQGKRARTDVGRDQARAGEAQDRIGTELASLIIEKFGTF